MGFDDPALHEGSNIEQMTCPLCLGEQPRLFLRGRRRTYMRCQVCGLVFGPPAFFLPADEEKRRYDLHRNSPHDPGYCRFLSRLFLPLQRDLTPGSHGLDFGSGPEPTLSRMFEAAGHTMTLFDRFYEPDPAALERQYDFITVAEVVEHLHEPGREMDRLWSCLRPGGTLGIMTQPAVERDAFAQWHYQNDLTHVCFFSPATFAWLAARWGAELTAADADVFLFHK